jgi:hypothetical protein
MRTWCGMPLDLPPSPAGGGKSADPACLHGGDGRRPADRRLDWIAG